MKRYKPLFEMKLNQPSKLVFRELDKMVTKKPSSWQNMPVIHSEAISSEARKYLESLPNIKHQDLYGHDSKNVNPLNLFANPPEIQYFILVHGNGKTYLINTEGYSYIRFGAQVVF